MIDHLGVIRHKWLGFPGEETFDSAVGALVEKAGGKKAEPARTDKKGTD